MKKKIITCLSILSLALSTTVFTGCANDSYSKKQDLTQSTHKGFADGYFTIVKEWGVNLVNIKLFTQMILG